MGTYVHFDSSYTDGCRVLSILVCYNSRANSSTDSCRTEVTDKHQLCSQTVEDKEAKKDKKIFNCLKSQEQRQIHRHLPIPPRYHSDNDAKFYHNALCGDGTSQVQIRQLFCFPCKMNTSQDACKEVVIVTTFRKSGEV